MEKNWTKVKKQGDILELLKNGSGIHIKKKNRGKFTEYCGGLVTQECINKGKHSSNPAIRKRATFADNARKWVKKGEFGMPAPSPAKIFIDKNYNTHYIDSTGLLRNRPYNWSTFDKMYREGKAQKIPYNTLIALMANVAVESGGYEDLRLIDWNHKKGTPWRYLPNGGTGLIQYTGLKVPENQRQAIYDSILNPHHSDTNYWKSRDKHRSNLLNGRYGWKDAIKHYRLDYIRPGTPALDKAYIIGENFVKIYPKYQLGGWINTAISKANKVLNSNTGKSIINGIGSAVSYINGLKQTNLWEKGINETANAIKNDIDMDQINSETLNDLNTLKQQNPDVNYGNVDFMVRKQKRIDEALKKASANAEKYKAWNLSELNNYRKSLTNDFTSGISSSILDGISGVFSSSLNKPQYQTKLNSFEGLDKMSDQIMDSIKKRNTI